MFFLEKKYGTNFCSKEEAYLEHWDLYDKQGNFTNRRVRRGEPIPAGYYHLAVDIWIINSCQEFLIQKRAPTKRIAPTGYLDN